MFGIRLAQGICQNQQSPNTFLGVGSKGMIWFVAQNKEKIPQNKSITLYM